MNKITFLTLTVAFASVCLAGGESRIVPLNVGDTAPEFVAVDDAGEQWKSADHIGRQVVVLYFYPADMSRDCTLQACGFQKHLSKLRSAGVKVVGISGDRSRNHQLFKKLNSLNFPLLSDEDGKVARAFGVPVRKGGTLTRIVSGEQTRLVRGVTPRRWTFVIGLNGAIIHKNTRVDAEHDGQAVLKIVSQFTASTK